MAFGDLTRDMLIRLVGDSKPFDEALKSAASNSKRFKAEAETAMKGVSIASAALTAQVVALAAGTKKAADAAGEGQKFIELERSFKTLQSSAGLLADESLAKLRTATQGMVSDMRLMEQANKAVQLGLDPSTLGVMAEAATKLGASVGRDATEAFEDLVTGVGRASPLILDNLGITIKANEAYDRYAASLKKATKDLTENEKAEAFRAVALEKIREKAEQLDKVTINAGLAAKQFDASWDNAVNQITRGIAESEELAVAFNAVSEAISKVDWKEIGNDIATFLSIVTRATEKIILLANAYDDLFNRANKYVGLFKAQTQGQLAQITTTAELAAKVTDLRTQLEYARKEQQALGTSWYGASGDAEMLAYKIRELEESLASAEKALAEGKTGAEAFASALGSDTDIGGKKSVKKAVEEITEASKKAEGNWHKWTQDGLRAADTLEDRFYDLGNALFDSLQGALDGDFNVAGLANAILQGFGGSIQQLGGLLGGGFDNIGPVASGSAYGEMLGGAGPVPSLIYGGIAGTAASGIRAIERLLAGRDVSFTDQLALAPVTGGFSLLANLPGLFNSGKDPDQRRRDSIRDRLRGTGLGDDLILRGIRGDIDIGRADYNVGSGLGEQSIGLVSGLGSLFGGDETGRNQLTAMFANAVSDAENFNEALIQTQTLMQQLGVNAEQAKNELTQLFLDGEIGLEEYQRGMESFNLAAQDNLVGTGSVRDALNVVADATSTNRARLQGLRLTFVELAEIGVDSVAEIRDYFTERFGPDVGDVFAMLADAGIDFANITADQVQLIFNALTPILNVLETELPNAYKRAEKSAENFAKSAVSSANSAADALGRIGQLGGSGLITDVGTIQNLIRTGQSRTNANKGVGINS